MFTFGSPAQKILQVKVDFRLLIYLAREQHSRAYFKPVDRHNIFVSQLQTGQCGDIYMDHENVLHVSAE